MPQDTDAVLADVQEADEHASGYLPGAVNMAQLRIRAACILSDRPLYVHCQRGTRAVRILEKAGFRQAGGIGGITIPEKTGEVSGTYGEDKAAKTGTIFELNENSYRDPGLRKNCKENQMTYLALCKKYGVHVTIGSDAHFMDVVGQHEHNEVILKEADFPMELVMNTSAEKLINYLKARKAGFRN